MVSYLSQMSMKNEVSKRDSDLSERKELKGERFYKMGAVIIMIINKKFFIINKEKYVL